MQALAEGDGEGELRCYWTIYTIIYGNLTHIMRDFIFYLYTYKGYRQLITSGKNFQ